MRTRSRRGLSLFLTVALSAALTVSPGSAFGGASPVAGAAVARLAVKQPRTAPASLKTRALPLPAKVAAPVVRVAAARSVVDASVTHIAADAPIVVDPLAPAVLGELVVVLDSAVVAPSAERALEARGATVDSVKGDAATLLVRPPGGVNDPVFTRLAQDAPGVAWVQPNYIYHAAYVAGDPLYGQQWGLPQIGAPKAWDVTRGKGSVVVAVVDTGVDYTHPDLAGRVDTANDHDFVNGDSVAMDDNGHGTHVSGIIAAVADNAIGGAGVAPGCTILPVKVLDSKGSGTTIGVAAGIRYAADAGARIINLSLEGPSDTALGDAVAYARSKGCVVVAAAGNDGSSGGAAYPARYDGVVGVGAVDPTNARATFSNYGAGVDVCAPGVGILSTVPWTGSASTSYASLSGTSMASPFVSAVAALVWSEYASWDSTQVIGRVLSTAQDLGSRTSFGAGLVRADAAVAATGVSGDHEIPGIALEPTPVLGSLDVKDPAHKDDVYSVYLGEGQTLDATLTAVSGTNFDLWLYGPDATKLSDEGSVVASSPETPYPAHLRYRATSPGLYYLDAGALVGAGSYTLSWSRDGLSDDNIPGVPLPVSPVRGTVDRTSDPFDVYRIDLKAGQQLSVHMSGPANADFDLWLFGPGSTSVDVSPPLMRRESPSSNEMLRYVAATAGTYWVMVYAYDGAGSYQLDWSTDPFSPDSNIPGLELPKSSVTATVGGLSDTDDVYKVFMQAGQTIDCTLTDRSGTYPVLYLYDPTSTDVDVDPWVAEATDTVSPKSLRYTAQSTGWYYVDVYGGGDPGLYQLDWSTKLAPDDNIPGVAAASPISGALGVTTDTDDVYKISAHAGDWISATLVGSPAASTDFDLYLYSPNATDARSAAPVARADGSRYPKAIGFKATVSGVYFLQAHAFAGDGAYSLTWSAKPFAHVYTPVAPSHVTHGRRFTVSGYVAPRHTSGTYVATLQFYRKDSHGAWVYHHSVSARRYASSSTRSRYSATVSLPHDRSWRVRAMHADAGHATSYSGYRYISAR